MSIPNWDSIFGAISLIASIASLVLAVLAIWLAFKFYELTIGSEKRSEQSSNAITAAVERLEKVFELQYADTFSMVRDTYADFRRHVLVTSDAVGHTDQLAEAKARELALALKQETSAQLERIIVESPPGRGAITAQQEIAAVVTRAIDRSLSVDREARAATVRSSVLEYLRATNGPNSKWRVGAVVGRFKEQFQIADIVKALFDLQTAAAIAFNGQFSNWVEIGPEATFIVSDLAQASELASTKAEESRNV